MDFYDHSKLKGLHATLSASQYRWLNYEPNKLTEVYLNGYAQTIGTVIHELACKLIKSKMRLKENDHALLIFYLRENKIPEFVISNLNLEPIYINLCHYVNDAIGYGMSPEVVLYHSDNCFGTTDAISYNKKKLRIHDLKTGLSPAHMEQLEIYAGLFCLEYKIKPAEIHTELRIYQNTEILVYEPTVDELKTICNKIIDSNNIIDTLKNGGRL